MRKILAGLIALCITSAAFAQTAVVQSVNNAYNKVQSYHGSATVTLAATPRDFIALVGSATKTVYIKNITVSCTKTTAGYNTLTLMKRSVANTGGTSTTITASPSDSANAAATASMIVWTTNPTEGTGVSMTQDSIFIPVSTTAVDTKPYTKHWGDQMDQYIVLRGVAQELVLSFGGGTTTGGVCSVNIRWLEQ